MMYYLRTICVVVALLLSMTTINAQLTQWVNLTNQQWINRILVDGDVLWITTMGGGVVSYDKTTGDCKFITHIQGLTDNQATGIARCGEQIWIGGRNYGVDVYENGKFVNYNVAKDGLKSNFFNWDIAVDKSGNVWIAGLAAIYKYDGVKFQTFSVPWWDLSPNGIISALEFDSDGNLWYGAFCFGKVTPDGEVVVIEKNIFNDTHSINDIVVADDGIKWIASRRGLYTYDDLQIVPVVSDGEVSALDIDSKQQLWYSDARGNLIKYAEANSEVFAIPSQVEEDFAMEVVCDADIIWLGMRKSGLWKFQNGEFERIDFGKEYHSLVNYNNIVVDRDGNALFTTSDGVMKVDRTEHFSNLMNAIDSAVVYIDKDDVLWIAPNDVSATALIKIDGSDTIYFTTDNSPLKPRGVNVIYKDLSGRVWLGTDYGVLVYDGKLWKEYNIKNSALSSNRIVDITSDGSSVWVSTHFHGLNKIDGDRITVFDKTNSGIPSNFTRSIVFDDNGNLWCATCDDSDVRFEMSICGPEFGYGLTKFDGQKWTNYNSQNSPIQSNTIMDIEIDKYGNIWLATMGDCGLTCFDGNSKWTNFSAWNSGISYNFVNDIAIDANTDVIWLDHLLPEGVSSAKIDVTSTAVQYVEVDSVVFRDGCVYDILGRRVERENMIKGQVYIQNGKKSVVMK